MSDPGSDEDVRAKTQAAIMAVWRANKPIYLERVAQLARAAEALREGRLDPEARAEAMGEAHKIAGAVGTFGYLDASAMAKDAERLLRADAILTAADGDRLAEMAIAIQRMLDGDG